MDNQKIVNLYTGHYDDGIIEGYIINNYELYEELELKKKVLSFEFSDGGYDTRTLELGTDKGILKYSNNSGANEERKIIKVDKETWRLDKSNEQQGDFYGETLKYYFPI